jgi:hypothetical protein
MSEQNIIELIAKIDGRFEAFEAKLDGVVQRTERAEKKMGASWKSVGDAMDKAGARLSKVGDGMYRFGMTAAKYTAGAIVAVGGVGLALVKMGSDAEESENLFRVSFGSMEAQARKWSEDFKKRTGSSEFAARKMAGTLNVMSKSMGVSEEKAMGISTGLTELANDMASFYNIDVETAFDKLRAGISGEAEPLKQLGILINETETKNYAWRTGIAATGEALTETQKVMARYGLIMERTKDAQGDLARTGNGLANLMRRVGNVVGDALKQIGMTLKGPIEAVLAEFMPKLETALTWLVTWFETNQETIQNFIRNSIDLGLSKLREFYDYIMQNKDALIEWGKGAFEFFKSWGPTLLKSIPIIMLAGKGISIIGGLLSIGGSLVTGIGYVSGAVKALGVALKVMSSGLGPGGPIFLIIVGFAALLETFNNPTGFDNFLTRMIDKYIPWLGKSLDWISDKVVAFLDLFNTMPTGEDVLQKGLDYDDVMKKRQAMRAAPEDSWQGPVLPGNAAGTRNWRGGLSWVGEKGPELLRLPRGAQVFPHAQSMQMAGAAGDTINITVDVATQADPDAIAGAIARRLRQIRG